MVTLGTIVPALEQGDWFSALNRQDAYFHITIHPAHRRYLQFMVGHNHLQYRVLPFRLSTALRVFSKTLAVVAAYQCKQGIIFFPYLDDCLLKGCMFTETETSTQLTIHLFQKLGLQLNVQKSTLVPTQQLDFIGAHLDSVQARAFHPIPDIWL